MQMSMHLQHAFFNTLWLWMWRWLWLWLWLWQNANVKTNPNAMSIHCDTGQSKSLFVWFHACTNDQSLVGCNTGMRMWMPMPMPMPMPIPDALAETTILFESNIFFFCFPFCPTLSNVSTLKRRRGSGFQQLVGVQSWTPNFEKAFLRPTLKVLKEFLQDEV